MILEKRILNIKQKGQLTKEENKELVKEFLAEKNAGKPIETIDARTLLILGNEHIVYDILKRYDIPYDEDVVSVGKLGLVKAIDSVKSNTKQGFNTLLIRKILAEILSYLNKKDKLKVDFFTDLENDSEIFNSILNNSVNDFKNIESDFLEEDKKQQEIKSIYNSLKYLNIQNQIYLILRYGLFGVKPVTMTNIIKMLNYNGLFSINETKTKQKVKILCSDFESLNEEEKLLYYNLKRKVYPEVTDANLYDWLKVISSLTSSERNSKDNNDIIVNRYNKQYNKNERIVELFPKKRNSNKAENFRTTMLSDENKKQQILKQLKHLSLTEQGVLIYTFGLYDDEPKPCEWVEDKLNLNHHYYVSLLSSVINKMEILLADYDFLSEEKQKTYIHLKKINNKVLTEKVLNEIDFLNQRDLLKTQNAKMDSQEEFADEKIKTSKSRESNSQVSFVIDRDTEEDYKNVILNLLPHLTPFEQYIAVNLFGLYQNKKLSVKDISTALNCSTTSVYLSKKQIRLKLFLFTQKYELLKRENQVLRNRLESKVYPVLNESNWDLYPDMSALKCLEREVNTVIVKRGGDKYSAINLVDFNQYVKNAENVMVYDKHSKTQLNANENLQKDDENAKPLEQQKTRIIGKLILRDDNFKAEVLNVLGYLSITEQCILIFKLGLYNNKILDTLVIADKLGISISNLHSTYYRALSKIKILLADYNKLSDEEKKLYDFYKQAPQFTISNSIVNLNELAFLKGITKKRLIDNIGCDN